MCKVCSGWCGVTTLSATRPRVHISQSATPATQNATTQRWKPPKLSPRAELPIGTATFCHDGCSSTCHNVPHLPRETMLHHTKNDATCNFLHRHWIFLPPRSRVHMSQSATHATHATRATRDEATSYLAPPKMMPFATFPIGTVAFCHVGRSQTVADGC